MITNVIFSLWRITHMAFVHLLMFITMQLGTESNRFVEGL